MQEQCICLTSSCIGEEIDRRWSCAPEMHTCAQGPIDVVAGHPKLGKVDRDTQKPPTWRANYRCPKNRGSKQSDE
jgi:hypothetical protein